MWIKKINEFFDKLSEYDNNTLLLHVAVNIVNMLQERVIFSLDDDGEITIKLLKYADIEEDLEIDEDGLLHWLQFTFHKELIDIILSLKQKFTTLEDTNKQHINDSKFITSEDKQKELSAKVDKNEKEMEALSMIVNKVDAYRKNTFAYLQDKDSVEQIVKHIKIHLEQSD